MRVAVAGPALSGRSEILRWVGMQRGRGSDLAPSQELSVAIDGREVLFRRVLSGNLYFPDLGAASRHSSTSSSVACFRAADAILFLLDAQRPMFPSNIEALRLFETNLEKRPILYLVNKTDLPLAASLPEVASQCGVAQDACRSTAAVRGIGVDEAVREIVEAVARRGLA